MIDWLSRHGFDCTVITTYPYYPYWKVQEPYGRRAYWYSKEVRIAGEDKYVDVYRCPHYVPQKPSGMKRVLMDLSFSLSALVMLLTLLPAKRFDTVITVAPPFHLGFLALLYKTFRKSRFMYHVQDLQIEAARDLGLVRNRGILRTLFAAEATILKRADVISSISDGMIRKIREKCRRPVRLFPNWSDVQLFHPLPEKGVLKKAFGFAPEEHVVLYSGAIGEKQGLQSIIGAARILRERGDVRFVVCGSGPYKEKLMDMAAQEDLANIVFLPLQPLDVFNEFLNMADVHLILQKAGASDLVMPSKLTNILAVGGLSIVTAEPGSSLYDVVERHGIGLLVPSEDPAALARGIEQALSKDHSFIHDNSRKYAETFLSIDGVLGRYFESV